jgi:hypothetical protein
MNYSKYTDALAAMDEIITSSASLHSKSIKGEIVAEDAQELKLICTQWDELYDYVFANFKNPESYRKNSDVTVDITSEVEKELAGMKEMFKLNREEIEEQLYKIPPVILEQCFPVWMARYMLCFCNVPISPLNVTTWDEFFKMYGYMVCYCYCDS